MKIKFYKGKNGQPLTPCCKVPFIAVPTKPGFDIFCENCLKPFDNNLREVKINNEARTMR